ncbi:MAG: NUDIX hydrolase [Alphaproteobacteria bacterium]|nr:MAG: NUDIX hydrolase [Alphaproteobacteria bacterium]
MGGDHAVRDKARLRDAATVILIRRDGPEPRVLMGQRGAGAAFMPSKFVFPGGAVDVDDLAMGEVPLDPDSARRLSREAPPGLGHALALAAIRETWEETGLALGRPGRAAMPPDRAPPGWRGFLGRGLLPATERLRFIFRAITPPGRPRRFDARFFLADAAALADDPDDLSRASGELGRLCWLPLAEARALEMPFITEIVLAEVAEILRDDRADRPVPFFRHGAERSEFIAL